MSEPPAPPAPDAPVSYAAPVTPEARARDAARLAALHASGLLDADALPEFDRIARLAARALRVPAAFVSLVCESEDVFLASSGLPEPLATTRAVTGGSFCRHAIAGASPEHPLVVRDAARDPRWRDVPTVASMGVAAYIGVPLLWQGEPVGAMGAYDVVPRDWTAGEVAVMQDAAAAAQHALALRDLARTAGEAQRRVESVLSSISDAFFTLDRRWRFAFVNDRAEQVLQRGRGALLQRTIWEEFPAAIGSVFEREYRRAMATGEPVAFDAHYPPPLDAWYEVRAYPGPDGLAVYFQDVTERRRSEAALAESEARFRAVQDASADGAFLAHAVRDADGRIVDLRFGYLNAAARQVLLLGDAPVVGRTLSALFPESVAAGRLAVYAHVIESGEPWVGQVDYVRHGARRGLRVTAVKVGDGVHLAFADLSERIRAAEERERLLVALQEERAVRDAVNAQMPAGLMVVEAPAGRLLYWNHEAERLLGHPMMPVGDVSEYGPYGGVHADGRPYAPEEYPIARAVRGETLDQFPLAYRRPDGVVARLSVNAAPVRDADGAMTHAVCTITDVTAREAAAERTRQLQVISAALVAAVTPTEVTELFVAHAVATLGAFGGSMALIDADGAHATCAHAIGYTPAQVERWRTFPLALATPFGDAIRRGEVVVVSGADGWRALYPDLVLPGCTVESTSLFALPLLVGDRVIGVVGLGFRHVREMAHEERTYLQTLAGIAAQALDRARAYEGEHVARAEAEEARRRAETARREAELANAVKAQFLATMSHELRTPLNAIGGYTQLLEMGVHGPVTDAQAEALARVQRSQQHLLGLINSVLNYAKLEAGKVTYELTTAPALEIVRAVEALVAPQARAKGLALTVVDPGAPLPVRADLDKARQVVLNLLSNAVKFTPAGGRVTVTCTPDAPDAPGVVTIEVRDDGRGIPADQLPRVFDPFVQVGRRLTSEDEGTGLGLAISRDLARGMGGDLTAESAEGVGSTFRFTLPRADVSGA